MPKTVTTDYPEEAAAFIRAGGLVAFPTETVYGLGADVFNELAVGRIFKAKGRPPDNPLIVHISDLAQMDLLASDFTTIASQLANNFFPGPLTLVVKKSVRVPLLVTSGLQTVGIRMPRHALAARFLAECGTPVAAPSANLSGKPSPTTWRAVLEDLDGRIDCVLRGDATEIGLESTVVDCTGPVATILRLGAISIDDLRAVVPSVRAPAELNRDGPAKSPGTKHQHYTPSAEVVVLDDATAITDAALAAYIGVSSRSEPFRKVMVCADVADYARNLFEFFRECDRLAIKRIHCERVESKGIGSALMDRIDRAARR